MMEWQDIESAPRDGSGMLLAWPDGCVTIGRFDKQEYHKKPQPFFSGHFRGKIWERENQPRFWMPLPPPPKEQPHD